MGSKDQFIGTACVFQRQALYAFMLQSQNRLQGLATVYQSEADKQTCFWKEYSYVLGVVNFLLFSYFKCFFFHKHDSKVHRCEFFFKFMDLWLSRYIVEIWLIIYG
ncbi:putative cellulose synthase A catalytic subunit 5 [UDP-forming] [Iris pallida]|uniref:Cellulose synthase A catalytic subunit 5 [UDP-forming] n=1 Tax=Iris pallida TaxID=29817 RepID=A0AAX6GUE4_IRIPA|nr:putative cellulose synthase A catalytic subunit 5 [UDP-forming] [Iris pallida]